MIEALDKNPLRLPLQSLFLLGLILLAVPFRLFRRLSEDVH